MDYVYPTGTGAGTVDIAVKNSGGTNILTTTVNLTGSGAPHVKTFVPLNWQVPSGSGYALVMLSRTGLVSGLIRESSIGGYPYTAPGLVSITNGRCCPSASSTSYYYFYDWQVSSGCESPRTMVTATVIDNPVADAPSNVAACDSYTLPALTVGNYFSGTGGTGTAYSAGNNITSSMTMYVYAETGTTPNCTDENSFTITINTTPVADDPADVSACDSYTLPALTVGNYFSGTGGTGTAYSAGNNITSSMTMYIYAETGTTPNCTDENSFTITINTTPVADDPARCSACDSYTLPALTVGNYFSGTGGTGTAYSAGNNITSSMTMYVYAETGTTPNCTDENSFTITINSSPTATISGDASICSGNSTNLTLNFTGTAPWTYSINGGAPASTSNNPETVSVSPVSNTVYTITSLSDANCTGSGSGSATVNVSLVAPDFVTSFQAGQTSGCVGNTVTVTLNPVNNAVEYTWSAPAGTLINGQVGPLVTASNSVTVTLGAIPPNSSSWSICVVASNPCGTSESRCAKIRGILSAPSVIAGPSTACASTSVNYSVNAVAGASSYIWTGTGGITFTGSGTTITANFPGGFTSGSICVAGQLACGYTGPTRCMNVTTSVPVLGAMTGPFAVCPGQTNLVYTIAPVSGAATYNWTIPNNVTVNSGLGTNSVNVSIGPNFNIGNICVTVTSICGVVSPARCNSISSVKPYTPGNITGAANGICNTTITYSVPAAAGVTSYNWTAPAGATFATANGTNTIDVTYPANFTTGQLCVVAVNGCGSSPSRCINVKGVPASAGSISDPGAVCTNEQGVQFTIASIFGAVNYNWTVPSGVSIVAGQGTTTLTVDWGANSGVVGVTASNGCGNSGTKTRAVIVSCRISSSILPGAEVIAYPNPVSTELTVEMNTLSAGNYALMMTDLTGRVMLQQAIAATEGRNELKLDVSNYAKGVYLLTVQSEAGFTKQIRVTVQ
ncbi:MAG: T9SS type A sorting domain-containing protein [Bacteroidetes bacterium]|nr:T9SS type A sorting domain-containing protein [Bacteroidota bacterium]